MLGQTEVSFILHFVSTVNIKVNKPTHEVHNITLSKVQETPKRKQFSAKFIHLIKKDHEFILKDSAKQPITEAIMDKE